MDATSETPGAGANDELAAQLRRLQDDLNAIKETMAKGAQQHAQSMIGDVETFARENPRTVLAGALGLGLVLGLMLRRR